MSKELSEDSKFQVSLKTLGAIAVGITALVGFYYKLHTEIEEAKELPKPGKGVYIIDAADPNAKETWPPGRNEYQMKDQLARQTLMQIKKELDDLKIRVVELEEKVILMTLKNKRR